GEGGMVECGQGPVVDHGDVLVAPRRVEHLADGHLRHVTGDQPVDEPGRIAAGDQVLEERRYVDERGRVADGVVLVLVVPLVGADGVVAGPFPIVEALAEGKGALVDCGSDGHSLIILTLALRSVPEKSVELAPYAPFARAPAAPRRPRPPRRHRDAQRGTLKSRV